jgi:hypothetical protein
MPNREDEFWAGQKDGLRYCYKHKRYYDERVGCQLCYIDELNLEIAVNQVPELKQCPQCKERSLFWNEYARQFECLNLRCKKTYSKEKFDRSGGQQGGVDSLRNPVVEETERSVKEAPRFDQVLKCPRCGQTSVLWNRYFVYYECGSCRKAFAQDEMSASLATDTEKIAESEPGREEHPKEQAGDSVKEATPSQGATETLGQSRTPIPLQVCPLCKEQSLVPNQAGNGYECLNAKCRGTFFKATVDRFNQQTEAQKKALDALREKETKAWFGNQYYDHKRKQWRDGKQPRRVKLKRNDWLWIVILLIVISILVTLVLNYFYPNSRFAIFIW